MKKVKWLCFIMPLCLLACCLVGCLERKGELKNERAEEKTKNEPDATVILGPQMENMDPIAIHIDFEMSMLFLFFEGLMKFAPDGKIIPAMAETYDVSDDGMTYTFHLRPSAWSDGKPVTAFDFAYAWQRAATPKEAAPLANLLDDVARNQDGSLAVKAVDEKTFEVKLATPIPYFLDICTSSVTVPLREDIIEKYGNAWSKEGSTYVCNGPFMLEKRTPTTLDALKNELYWDKDNIKVNWLRANLTMDDKAAEAAFRRNEVLISVWVPSESLDAWYGTPELNLVDLMGTICVAFNSQAKELQNPLIRKAITLAINRKELVDLFKLSQQPASGYIGFVFPDVTRDKKFREVGGDYFNPLDVEGNLEQAKEALVESGHPNGKGLKTLDLMMIAENSSHKQLAEKIQEDLTKIGIKINMVSVDSVTSWANIRKGNYVMTRWGWAADFPHALSMFTIFHSKSDSNPIHLKDLKLDGLIERARITSNQEECMDLLHEIEDILIKNYYISPLFYGKKAFLASTKVKGVYATPAGLLDVTRMQISN
ncbi:MAG: peptide ABC transporter substrate-binding protein [Oscillospiraceae bacterium]|nr:peptide ABC transporter substrate-binding protein [Oscillospiraceae bacterium]